MDLTPHFPVASHTRNVGPGSTFVAINGTMCNGIDYINEALASGAATIVVQDDQEIAQSIIDNIESAGAQLVRVANARLAIARMSAKALGYPARKLKIIGITGTKGKTTSSHILEHIIACAGFKTAHIGTAGNAINGQAVPGALTTPLPDYLQMFLHQCVQEGVEYVVMEVSAQALSLHRVEEVLFDGVLFTNFATEHAEFYATMDDYFAAKLRIFDYLKSGAPAVLNADDERVGSIAVDANLSFIGIKHQVDMWAEHLDSSLETLTCEIKQKNGAGYIVSSPLVGEFNVYNILGVLSLAMQLGIDGQLAVEALRTMPAVPGRLERYRLDNGAYCIIDYAHNPSSYEALFSLLRPFTHQLIVLFGAGGSRDVTKRPIMGAIAAEYADTIVLTSDNPRNEDPEEIVNAIIAGIPADVRKKIVCELDRERAIELAYQNSSDGAIIVLLGKGPDEYQEVHGVKTPFSEKSIIQRYQ